MMSSMILTSTNYKIETYYFILVFVYAATSLGMGLTDNAHCIPRLTAVPLDGPNHNTFPYFMELLRCSGSWKSNNPNEFECVADKTEDVNITRFNKVTHKIERHTLTGKDGNHTSCKHACTIKPEHCPTPNTYDPVRCTCNCNHRVAPTGYECPALKSWHIRTCSCHCKKTRTCEKRFTWSNEKCGCVCKPKRRQTCTFKGGIFDETNCGCRKAYSQSQRSGCNDGKFIGSRAFWIYTLIGEFLLMIVMFDMILFCKKSGMLYNLTRICRAVEGKETQPSEVAGDGNNLWKTTVSSLQIQSVVNNAYTEQEPSDSKKDCSINVY